jgi:N-acyl-D-aspartate/D-glutamate deacylase
VNTILLRGGTIHDGTGREPYVADVLVEGDEIAAVGRPEAPEAEMIDAFGLVVAPGFIDVHSHSDFTLLVDPRACSAIAQGVTLEIVGNCGHGCAPFLNRKLGPLSVYGPIQCHPAPPVTMGDYLTALSELPPAVNVMMLAPNGQLRLGTVGLQERPAATDEAKAMARELEAALDEGAMGYSTGLEYAQERGATEAEVAELARISARRGGFYATHTRDRDAGALGAVEEAIRTARAAGSRLQISHITPRSGPGMIARCIEAALDARSRGEPVWFDMHTRTFGFTHLKNIVPPHALEGSPDEIRGRLADLTNRTAWRNHRNLISGVGDWSKVVLVRSAHRREFEGKSFLEIGLATGRDPYDAALDILAADADQLLTAMVILLTYDEDQLRQTYVAEDCMIGSDATALAPDGPLAGETFYGAYTWAAWFWRRMVRETATFSPAEAVRRMTSLPASVFGLSRRGRIAPGYHADIIAFESASFREAGTLLQPNRLAEGMRHVLVNGVPSLRDGTFTGRRGGRVIRKAG